MVSKGLDFNNVGLVSILNADNLLNFPDFRAHERSYQLMAQVSGRAGRRNRQGLVIIQTAQPAHPIIANVIDNDYKSMFTSQCKEREAFGYPPFGRLIEIVVKHKNETTCYKAAKELAGMLKANLGRRVIGPEAPLISRIQTYHLQHLYLKIEKGASLPQVRQIIRKGISELQSKPGLKNLFVYADVDPM
jgi:primosomal protein N' (replication factor Y)